MTEQRTTTYRIGIISDTHGLLRPEVFQAFADVDHILHAGDVGDLDILTELEAIAPVTAVWGNVDGMGVRARLPEAAEIDLAGLRVAIIHGHQFAAPTPRLVAERFPGRDLIVFGHSHQAEIERVGDSLVVNPGSAGPRRFTLGVTVAVGEITSGKHVEVQVADLLVD